MENNGFGDVDSILSSVLSLVKLEEYPVYEHNHGDFNLFDTDLGKRKKTLEVFSRFNTGTDVVISKSQLDLIIQLKEFAGIANDIKELKSVQSDVSIIKDYVESVKSRYAQAQLPGSTSTSKEEKVNLIKDKLTRNKPRF